MALTSVTRRARPPGAQAFNARGKERARKGTKKASLPPMSAIIGLARYRAADHSGHRWTSAKRSREDNPHAIQRPKTSSPPHPRQISLQRMSEYGMVFFKRVVNLAKLESCQVLFKMTLEP